MVQAVSEKLVDQYDVFHFSIADDVEPDARKIRDRKAKELRGQGWNVVCKRVGFADLMGCNVYMLDATRPKQD